MIWYIHQDICSRVAARSKILGNFRKKKRDRKKGFFPNIFICPILIYVIPPQFLFDLYLFNQLRFIIWIIIFILSAIILVWVTIKKRKRVETNKIHKNKKKVRQLELCKYKDYKPISVYVSKNDSLRYRWFTLWGKYTYMWY